MTNTTQVFKVAGITTHGDSTKVRFTDDMVRRIKQFTKGGATRVDLVELPTAMTKVEALKYLQAHAEFQSAGDQATIADSLADRVKEVKVKTPKAVKAKVVKVTKTKPSLDAIKARAKKVTVEAVTPEVA
ncbi:MAG: hypothetical protein WCR20_14985 [Verrucomicrobiota bacterium]